MAVELFTETLTEEGGADGAESESERERVRTRLQCVSCTHQQPLLLLQPHLVGSLLQ